MLSSTNMTHILPNAKCQSAFPVNTKHLYNIFTMLDQRRRRCADVVQMVYKCVEFAGSLLMSQAPNADELVYTNNLLGGDFLTSLCFSLRYIIISGL